jgi:hypothetical protein
MLLMVQRMCSALPFCGEVYEQDIRRITPLVAKNTREKALSNSRQVSHSVALMVRPNCVETYNNNNNNQTFYSQASWDRLEMKPQES